MTIPSAAIIGGAKGRLMPAGLIYSFFAAAALYHLFAWVVIAFNADEVPSFVGGPGSVLAAVHLLTLGVLVMTAIGAAMQLLSVVTKKPFGPVGLCWLVAWLFIPGVGLLAYGMAAVSPTLMTAGGSLVGLGLFVFIALFMNNLREASGIGVTLAHCWAAVASLVVIVLLGLALIANYGHGFWATPQDIAAAHFLVAAFGFMGLLALGFSHILVPMFALAPAPAPILGYVTLGAAVLAIASSAGGAIAQLRWALALGAGLGLVATGLYVKAMVGVLAGRARKRLGVSFLLVRAGWVLLPASLVAGLLAVFGLAGERGAALFGFLVLCGWLLTFLLGILQRIIPFLATMHAGTSGGRRLTISEIGNDRAIAIHAVCHGIAIAAVAAGIATAQTVAVSAGAALGGLGAAAFAWFTLGAIVKTFRHPVSPLTAPGKRS